MGIAKFSHFFNLELNFTLNACVAAVYKFDKQDKSVNQTTKTDLLLVTEHRSLPFTQYLLPRISFFHSLET